MLLICQPLFWVLECKEGMAPSSCVEKCIGREASEQMSVIKCCGPTGYPSRSSEDPSTLCSVLGLKNLCHVWVKNPGGLVGHSIRDGVISASCCYCHSGLCQATYLGLLAMQVSGAQWWDEVLSRNVSQNFFWASDILALNQVDQQKDAPWLRIHVLCWGIFAHSLHFISCFHCYGRTGQETAMWRMYLYLL